MLGTQLRVVSRLARAAPSCAGVPVRLLARRTLATTRSVVEEATEGGAAPVGGKAPVPMKPGELLLYRSDGSAQGRILLAHVMPVITLAYGAVAYSFNGMIDSMIGLSPTAMAVSMFLASAALYTIGYTHARKTVRYAVLTPDGHHLRLYPYGKIGGFGASSPVTIPVANLSTSTWNTKAKMNDQVTVTLPNAPLHHILFDKPPVMDIKAQTGTGLLFNDAGVTGIKTGTPGTGEESLVAAAGSGIMLPSAVYTMKPDQRAALRGYALMCLVLSGKPVDMARVFDDSWQLETMARDLAPAAASAIPPAIADHLATSGAADALPSSSSSSSTSSAAAAAAAPATPSSSSAIAAAKKAVAAYRQALDELVYWRRATDQQSGRDYWYNEVTRVARWNPPMVDGKNPDQWFPDRFTAE